MAKMLDGWMDGWRAYIAAYISRGKQRDCSFTEKRNDMGLQGMTTV